MSSMPMAQLSPSEVAELTGLEATIERGLATFVEVGNALMAIRDGRLYRMAHSTFEEYCQERWGMQRAHAYRLMDSAAVVANLSPMGDILPTAERQVRPLTSLPPASQREVWATAVQTAPEGRVTAAHVQTVAETYRRPVAPPAVIEPVAHELPQERMAVHYSSASDDWATPQDLFDQLDAEFGFTLDVCATAGNAKCGRFFSPEQNGLAQSWQGACWMNPPYGDDIPRWVEKAHSAARQGATVVCLVPARTDTAWWWNPAHRG